MPPRTQTGSAGSPYLILASRRESLSCDLLPSKKASASNRTILIASIDSSLKVFSNGRTIKDLLDDLLRTTEPSLGPVIPFVSPARPMRLDGTPKIMQIFNATPDSFSDGNEAHLDPQIALRSIERMFDSPHVPDILDIGGMSTRPGSSPCTEQEEIDRVVPLVKLIRTSSDPRIQGIPISVDTYRGIVAEKAIAAGASCVNDVRGAMEEGMKEVMAKSGVPVVIMHSRGDSVSMTSAELQDYDKQGGVIAGVREELGGMVQRVLEAGVKQWDIALIPG
jgi:dihydroneopterin aldolase/2-amino-4-hydroxy-6-hydroxymethyldihydropteridine diphosphokinase/dihydropteroate synthase